MSDTQFESRIYMLGAFPPPVHGMAMVNAAMREHLINHGVQPVVLDLAPQSLSRSWKNRLRRIRKVALTFTRFWAIRHTGVNTLYIGLSGGLGQLYEALFVAVARFRGMRIFLHHHSFAYVDKTKLSTQVLTRLAGSSATHILICKDQERKLRKRYASVSNTRVISNAVIMWGARDVSQRTRTCAERIAFLGNISEDKGILEFIAIAERLQSQELSFQLCIAGPISDSAVESKVREAMNRLPFLEYVGPKYGSDKDLFLNTVDVLLFPSKYAHETAPLVVHEATALGIPVIAWERGCLSDMVPVDAGQIVKKDQDFVTAAVEYLVKWRRDPELFTTLSNAAANQFCRQHTVNQECLSSLLSDLGGLPSQLAAELANSH